MIDYLRFFSKSNFYCGKITIIGRSNVGKSTLANKLVGKKISATSNKFQTTISSITSINTIDNIQYIFIDTPGFQIKNKFKLLSYKLNRDIISELNFTNIILFVIEANKFKLEDKIILDIIPLNIPIILIINKIDTLSNKYLLYPFVNKIRNFYKFNEIIPLSAQFLDCNINLLNIIKLYLPKNNFIYKKNLVTAHKKDILVIEILREKIFRFTGHEIPYTSNILIDKFNYTNKRYNIFITICVKKNSHKAIIIGKKGNKLSLINFLSRLHMESLFNSPVYLSTFIKVDK